MPPFFGALMKYTSRKNDEYDSPGHQGGAFFRKHPAGRIFYDYYGPNVFRGDLSSSDVDLGDFLIHEGRRPYPPRSTRPGYFMRTKPISS